MSFVSVQFFVFLVCVFIGYFLVPPKHRWIVLLVGSYVFYLFTGVGMTLLLMFTTLVVFTSGILIDRVHAEQRELFKDKDTQWLRDNKKVYISKFMRKRRWILLGALLVTFGILGFLKYYNFFALNINILLETTGTGLPISSLLLPLGISFYTFQSVGYLVDVYREKFPADRNIAKFALFVSFFPQIVQGPISRYNDLASQLYAPNRFDYTRVKFGLQLIMWGYIKKMVIADRALILVNEILPNYTEYAGYQVAFGVLVATLQVYMDFSGGIDICRGIAQVMGIDMVENFRRPFFATSISDYWRRWHITLGSWMRDYLFYPLSLSKAFGKLGKRSRKLMGNHFGKIFTTCLAMFVVFLAVGVWHGAEWKYMAFGVYNGILIVIGILFADPWKAFTQKHPSINESVPVWRVFASLKTFFFVYIGKYISAAADFDSAMRMIWHSVTSFTAPAGQLLRGSFTRRELIFLAAMTVLLFFVSLAQERGVHLRSFIAKRRLAVRWIIYFAFLFLLLIYAVHDVSGMKGFVYANF